MNKVFFFGTSGGCFDAFSLYKEINKNKSKLVFLSDRHSVGQTFSGCEVVGPFRHIFSDSVFGSKFVYQCGSVENHIQRHVWFNHAIQHEMIPLTLVSNAAYIHETAKIGRGTIIYPGVRIMANVSIGTNCIILPNTVINHDAIVGDFSIINSLCVLNGGVVLGHNCYIGASTSIKEAVSICANVTIGMASVVLKTIKKEGLYFGTPAKLIE